MPTPQRRSRTWKRKKVRLPGGRRTVHYRKKKNSGPCCGSCGKILQGASSDDVAKTKKRPQRPYGGVLCFSCLQKLMVEKARAQ